MVIEHRKRHKWANPSYYPPGGIEFCEVCGATRVTTIPGYVRTPAHLNGVRQKFCPGKQQNK